MADLITRLKLANSEFNQSLNSSKQQVKEFQDTADDTSKTLEEMGDKGASAAKDILGEMSKVENGARSVTNYKKQLSDLQKQIVDLTYNYRSMTDEMKQSAKGLEIKGLLEEATAQAATMKDAIMDVNNEIKNLASDTVVWDGLKMGIDTASAALQGFVAMGVLGEESQEKLVAVIAKLKSIEAATNAVIKVGSALQKDSALMTSIRTVQTKLLTRAKDLETAATGRATIAQKLLNKACMANPYIILASAILAVVGAITAYVAILKKNKEQLDYTAKAQEAYNKALEDGRNEAVDNIAKFKLLETQYKRLKTEGEKKQWIIDNKDAMHDLGYEVKDVNDADALFIEHAKDVVKAMTLRAQAAALLSVYQEEYAKAVRESYDMEKKAASGKKSWGPGPDWKKIKAAGLKEGEDYSYTPTQGITYTESGRAKMKKYGEQVGDDIRAGAEESLGGLVDRMTDLEAQADALDGKWRTTSTSSQNTTKNTTKAAEEAKAALGSLTDAEQKLSEMQKKFKAMNPKDSGFAKMKKDVEDQEKLVEELRKEYEKAKEPVISIREKLELQKQELEAGLQKMEELSDEWKEQYRQIVEVEKKIKDIDGAVENYRKRLENPLQPIEMPVNPIVGKAEVVKVPIELQRDRLVEEYKKAGEELSRIKDWLDIGVISKNEAQKLVDNLNKNLEKKGIKVKLSLELDTKTLKDALDSAVDTFDKFSSVSNGVVGSFNSIYESVKGLGDALEEAETPWEQFFAMFQTGMTIFQSFTSIVEAVSNAIELMNMIKEGSIPLLQKENSELQKNTQENITDAAAKGVNAAAGAGESVSSIPYLGPILAAAAIATIMATILSAISTAKNFASGGIVPGNSMHGDKIMAGLNSGEMVLNTQQQKNLFKMLNEGRADSATGGQVEFKIRGTELVGVLNNQNKKNSKI